MTKLVSLGGWLSLPRVLLATGAAVLGAAAISVPVALASGSHPKPAAPPTPAATYSVNGHGETYGSGLGVTYPGDEPDLIQAVATNGREGYVKAADLVAAEGTPPASLSQAVQMSENPRAVAIPVYEQDGTTQIGEFVVGNGHAVQGSSGAPGSAAGKSN